MKTLNMFSSELYMNSWQPMQPLNSVRQWKLFDNPCQMEHGGFTMEICDLLTGFKNFYQKVA